MMKARRALQSDIDDWHRSYEKRFYHKRHVRCRDPLRHDELPAEVVALSIQLIKEKPYKSCRKYFMDVRDGEWEAIRNFVFERDNFTCVYCGATAEHIDHVLPLIQLGSCHPDNCVAACKTCNCSKGGFTPEQWRALV